MTKVQPSTDASMQSLLEVKNFLVAPISSRNLVGLNKTESPSRHLVKALATLDRKDQENLAFAIESVKDSPKR